MTTPTGPLTHAQRAALAGDVALRARMAVSLVRAGLLVAADPEPSGEVVVAERVVAARRKQAVGRVLAGPTGMAERAMWAYAVSESASTTPTDAELDAAARSLWDALSVT